MGAKHSTTSAKESGKSDTEKETPRNQPTTQTVRTWDFENRDTDVLYDGPPVTAVVVGAGHRGKTYAYYSMSFPNKLKIVAAADPSQLARDHIQQCFKLDDDCLVNDWRELAAMEKLADIAIITTQDKMHREPALAFASKGYHILLEKPMSTTYEECEEIAMAVKEAGVIFGVCHVTRYYPKYRIIKALIEEGVIGQVCQIVHTEHIGHWHFAHSYVRGNWRNEAESSPSLLAKSCHDLDLIAYLMGDNKCTKVSSFGSLIHFKKEDKPPNASNNCMDCELNDSCPYSAKRIYWDKGISSPGLFPWPVSAVCDTGDIEDLDKVLRTGPYGRCVYECDNDVMSHQTVNLQYEDGAIASVNMVGTTTALGLRETVVYGSLGEIRFERGKLQHYEFSTKKYISHEIGFHSLTTPFGLNSHGGADYYLIRSFVDAVIAKDQQLMRCDPDKTLYSHRLVFEAEKSRKQQQVIELDY